MPTEWASATILQGDCRKVLPQLKAASVHCCVTSSPYFGLRKYHGGDDEIGQEQRHDCGGWVTQNYCNSCFVCHVLEVGRGLWHVLRDDGVLFWNLGDSYVGKMPRAVKSVGGTGEIKGRNRDGKQCAAGVMPGLKPKDLMGVPWRCALALQSQGWYLRQEITWAKRPPMPESITDRPTCATEKIFMLTKSEHYYYDKYACLEPLAAESYGRMERKGRLMERTGQGTLGKQIEGGVEPSHGYAGLALGRNGKSGYDLAGRNLWNYWVLNQEPYKDAHFATFPSTIPHRAIRLSTSEKGVCPHCAAPWKRVVHTVVSTSKPCPKEQTAHEARGGTGIHIGTVGKSGGSRVDGYTETLGWQPTCKCPHDESETVSATVLDCFSGAGTTGVAAAKLGQHYIGIELNPDYIALSEKRIANVQRGFGF